MVKKPSNKGPESITSQGKQKSLWIRTLRLFSLLMLWLALALLVLTAYYAWDLPDLDNYEKQTRRPSITILAADNTVITTYGDVYDNAVKFNEVPPYLIQSIIATEDRRFFSHIGVDVSGIVRATLANVRAKRIRQGGSTLTQQLAKNLFLTPERSMRRKIQEIILAFWLEARFSKRQIITLYLNRVYFGAGTFGVAAAARRYFGKSVKNISLKEAALLSGLLKAPSRYSPFRNKKLSLKRANQVLTNMFVAGFLSKSDAQRAKGEVIKLANQKSGSGALYFADWLLQRAFGFVGRGNQDLIIKTTLSPYLQNIGEQQVKISLKKDGKALRVGQAALVSLSPDGAIRAMVGGRRYAASQFNMVNQALRQPGSAFKLFVYVAALESGLKPDDIVIDEPVSIDGWKPKNYTGKFLGPVTLRRALSESINTVAVKVSEKIGRKKVIKVAHKLGITAKLKGHPSIALGVDGVNLLDLTSAYALFANRGYPAWPYGIIEIRNNKNEILYRRSRVLAGRLVQKQIVENIKSMLTDVVKFGTGKRARLSEVVAGKSGTSQGFRDAWFIGFTKNLVTGVWVGNDNFLPMIGVTGGSLPAELWKKFMLKTLKRVPTSNKPKL